MNTVYILTQEYFDGQNDRFGIFETYTKALLFLKKEQENYNLFIQETYEDEGYKTIIFYSLPKESKYNEETDDIGCFDYEIFKIEECPVYN